jgi:hypothetical protein
LLNNVLKVVLRAASDPGLKKEFVRLVREHVVNYATNASPRLRQQLIEAHEAALDFWLTEYLAPPTPIYTYETDTK